MPAKNPKKAPVSATAAPPAYLDHSLAKLRLFVKGLSLLVDKRDPVNAGNDAFEIALLDKYHSDVVFELHNEVGDSVWPKVAFGNKRILLRIEKSSGSKPSAFYRVGPNPPTNPKDYRWMPDLAVWHREPDLYLKPTAFNHMAAKLVVRDAVFYTERQAVGSASRSDIDTEDVVNFAGVGTLLGADIACAATETIVGIAYERHPRTGLLTELERFSLDYNDGQHKLSISYDDTQPCNHDPLPLLYDYLIRTPNSARFRFEYELPQPNWRMNGWVADLKDPKKEFYPRGLGPAVDPKNRIFFDTKEDALAQNYTQGPWVTRKSDQYACQTYGGGDGPLPNFP